MNFLNIDEEKLDKIPIRERNHDYSWDRDSYWGQGLPYARLYRWLESQEGVNIDSVIHKFVNLKWLLKEYRNLEMLRRYIEFDTFEENGKIFYYSKYRSNEGLEVEKEAVKFIYVHPITKCVAIHKPPTPESWQKIRQKKLDEKLRILGDYHQLYKENGIWYEVKAEIAKEIPISYPYSSLGHPVRLARKGPKDIILEAHDSRGRGFYEPFVRVILKRQLNKKELKKHNLFNEIH